MGLGKGGLANLWNNHIDSANCNKTLKKLEREREKNAPKRGGIQSFLQPKVPLAASKATPAHTTLSKPKGVSTTIAGHEDTTEGPSGTIEEEEPATLTEIVRKLAGNLKDDETDNNEPFLRDFSVTPSHFDNPTLSSDELWEEVINPALHRLFGWGTKVTVDSIRRAGRVRVHGLVDFFEYFVGTWKLVAGYEDMLREKLEMVERLLQQVCPKG